MNHQTLVNILMAAGIVCFVASRLGRIEQSWINVALNLAGLIFVAAGVVLIWRNRPRTGA